MPIPQIEPDALARLLDHEWPGNVRELKNVTERLVVRRRDVVSLADLPMEMRLPGAAPKTNGEPDPLADGSAAVARRLLSRMMQDGESFWTAVYEPFANHDLTRDQLRLVVGHGLEQVQGRYSALIELFNMKKGDYKRFLSVLRKHQCLVPFHSFRNARPSPASGPDDRTAA